MKVSLANYIEVTIGEPWGFPDSEFEITEEAWVTVKVKNKTTTANAQVLRDVTITVSETGDASILHITPLFFPGPIDDTPPFTWIWSGDFLPGYTTLRFVRIRGDNVGTGQIHVDVTAEIVPVGDHYQAGNSFEIHRK